MRRSEPMQNVVTLKICIAVRYFNDKIGGAEGRGSVWYLYRGDVAVLIGDPGPFTRHVDSNSGIRRQHKRREDYVLCLSLLRLWVTGSSCFILLQL